MIRLLQGATILEVFYKRGSTLFNEDVLDFHHIKEQLQQHCSSTIAKELAMHIEWCAAYCNPCIRRRVMSSRFLWMHFRYTRI